MIGIQVFAALYLGGGLFYLTGLFREATIVGDEQLVEMKAALTDFRFNSNSGGALAAAFLFVGLWPVTFIWSQLSAFFD